MTEPNPLAKAEAAVRDAQTNTDVIQLALAAVELAKANAQAQPPACQHTPAQQFNSRKWLTIGGLGIIGALVLSLFAVAVAIGAVSVAILALVLRGLWHDIQKGR